MLTQLRAALAAEEGRPIRIEVLARRLGADPQTVAAMLEHVRGRGLGLAGCSEPGPGCTPSGAAPAACRHCPLVVPRSTAT